MGLSLEPYRVFLGKYVDVGFVVFRLFPVTHVQEWIVGWLLLERWKFLAAFDRLLASHLFEHALQVCFAPLVFKRHWFLLGKF